MQHLIESSSKWSLSEPNLGPNLIKWTLSGLKAGHVKIIGGGSCPRVDLVRKVGILCGKGEDFQKKVVILCGNGESRCHHSRTIWQLFRTSSPLPHNMATCVKLGRCLTHYRNVKMGMLCGRGRTNQGVKWTTRTLKPNELNSPSDPEHPTETFIQMYICLLYTSPSPRDGLLSRMPSSA